MIQGYWAVWKWCICSALFVNSLGFLDIDELTNSKYALQILHNPLNENDILDKNGLRLASKHGQDYFCSLPVEKERKTEKEDDKIPKSTPVESLLEPLRTDECFKIIKGWWTYELCYGRYILQYHSEANGEKGDITHLGYYESDFDWNKEALEENINSKRHKINRYHSQTYVNGTACDVINHKRDTEVRFLCEDSSLETYIERLDEPSTCSYIMTMKTPYICAHPRTKPVLKPTPESISCQPILSTHDFSEYEMVESLKEIQHAELLAKQRLQMESFFLEKAAANLMSHDFGQSDFASDGFLNAMINPDLAISRKVIESIVSKEDLAKLNPFQQKRLVGDVSNLLKLRNVPTADAVRFVQKYVTKYISNPSISSWHDFPQPSGAPANGFFTKKPVKVHLKFQTIDDVDKFSDIPPEDLLSTDDESVMDPAWKKLEEEINQGLEDAGYQTDDSHFEIRVIASKKATIEDSMKLDPEEGERFRQMLLELVAGGTAMHKEVEKQKSLADNYNMVWKRDSGTFKVQDLEQEDNEAANVKLL